MGADAKARCHRLAGRPQSLAGDVPGSVRGLCDARLELSGAAVARGAFRADRARAGRKRLPRSERHDPPQARGTELADQASTPARAIGAANTLTFSDDGTIEAHNTDAPGLIAALGHLTGMPAHPSALVLGAGGSARAAVWALQDAGAASVSVWNRSPERALELARDLGADAVAKPLGADLLVNCTSVGLQRSATEAEALNQLEMTADHVGRYAYVIDLVYGDGPTPLLVAAQAHGAATVGGLEVLVAQGALSFEHWTGRAAPRDAMRRGAGIEDDTG